MGIALLGQRVAASFLTAPTYAAGSQPWAIAVADFNGDGHADLVVVNNNFNGTITILLGKGDGTFQSPQSYAVGVSPVAVAVGDFNGDGILDLAVANQGTAFSYTDSSVSVLLGRGDGSFHPAQRYAAGAGPVALAVADINEDGRPDLVIANHDDSTVSILLGNGDGTFQAPHNFAAGTYPVSLAVADFDGDGHLDLAVASRPQSLNTPPNTINVLLGNGDGTLQAPQAHTAVPGYQVAQLVFAGDLNGDGIPDLVVGSGVNSPGLITILLGNGNGTFHSPQTYSIDGSPTAVALGDLNGDGIVDLAVATAATSWGNAASTVSILVGNGDGSFRTGHTYSVGNGPNAVAIADFNEDGHPDLVVPNSTGSTVSVLLGKGDGSFRAAPSYAINGGNAMAVGDFNGDGILDLAVASGPLQSGGVSIFLGKGDGTFQAPQEYQVGFVPYSLAVGDFNGDGKLDLALVNYIYAVPGPTSVAILLGNGDGTFRSGATFAAGAGANCVAVGDFNGDGKADIVTTNFSFSNPDHAHLGQVDENDVRIFLGNGDGTFQAAGVYEVSEGYPVSVVVGDFNRDGIADLAVSDGGGSLMFVGRTVSILLGNGDGTFQPAQGYAVDYEPRSVAIGDFNGDGIQDLVAVSLGTRTSTASVLLGNGDGTFQAAQTHAIAENPASVAVADFNGDGLSDFAVASFEPPTSISTSILLAHGDGTFQPALVFGAAGAIVVADFNADGFADIVVATAGNPGNLTILLNAADWP